MIKLLKDYGFVWGLLAAIGLAWLLPGWGAPGGWLQAAVTTKIGIFIIFMLQGLSLPTEELRRGLTLWRVHVFTQGFIFIGIPLLAYLLLLPFNASLGDDLRVGFLFLAILPCTISTSVVFVTQSGGNVAAALFNTSIANVAGIFIVPSFCAWLAKAEGESMPLLPLIGMIVLLLLVPLLVGQILRFLVPVARTWAQWNRKLIGRLNSGIVLFIVYCAFCGSFQSRFWEGLPGGVLWLAFGTCLVLLLLVMLVLYGLVRLVKFPYAEAVVAFFCGGQKTLAAGVPMAQGIFAMSGFDMALILLPLMFYAPLQFALGGVLVSRLQVTHGPEAKESPPA